MKLSTSLVLCLLAITCVQAKPASKLDSYDEDVDKRSSLEEELPHFDLSQDEEKRSEALDNELQEKNQDKRDLFEGDVNDEDDLSESNEIEDKRSMLESVERDLLEDMNERDSSMDAERRSETLEDEFPENGDKRGLPEENGLLKSDKDKRNLLEDERDENDFSEVEEY